MEHPKKSVWTRAHSKQTQETCAHSCTDRKTDVSLRLGKAVRSPHVCRKQIRKRLGERAALGPFIQAAETAQTQVEPNRLVDNRKIGRGPSVVAVDAIRAGAARGTVGIWGTASRVDKDSLAGLFNPIRETTSEDKWYEKISRCGES